MSGLSCCRNDAAWARAMPVNSHAMVLKSMEEIAVAHSICHGGVDGVTFYPTTQAVTRLLRQALARLAPIQAFLLLLRLRDCL